MYIFIYLYMYICICVFVYVFIYIYIYICIYLLYMWIVSWKVAGLSHELPPALFMKSGAEERFGEAVP